jgi:cell division protein FtsL
MSTFASYNRRAVPRKLRGKMAIGLALFGIACFIKVWQRVSIDQMNRFNWQKRLELRQLKRENALLIVRVEQLKSYERITRIAREQLGLVSATKLTLYEEFDEKK